MTSPDEQSEQQTNPIGHRYHRLTILRMLSMGLATAALVLFSELALRAPCWGIFILIGLIAWPVWLYRTEYALLRRRLVLSAVARPHSRIRAWLWRGNISKGIQVVVSIVLAWVLLALVSRLSLQHWIALAADSIFLALIITPVSRRLTDEFATQHLGTIARHWPLFVINGVVLTAAIMALDFFLVGAADSRHLPWHQVAVQVFTQFNNQAACVLWGVSAGLLAAGEALAWHTSQIIIPNLPDPAARLIAWSLFLLRAATVAGIFTILLLGVSMLVEKRQATHQRPSTGSTITRAFLLTIIVLAIPFFYAAIKLNAIDPAIFEQGVEDAAGLINPCKPDSATRNRLIATLDRQVEQQRRQAVDEVDTDVDAGLETLFLDVERGVDNYLDWYFTVFGEYQRLAAVLTDNFVDSMRAKLEQYLFAEADFDARLRSLDEEIEHGLAERFTAMAPGLRAELDKAPCNVGALSPAPLTELDRDALRASAAAAGGVGTGVVVSKALAKKTAAAVAAKLAAKKSFQTSAALTSKALAKKGSSSLLSAGIGTALCAPSGPIAIICGVSAGLVTWLTVDKALVELDDALNREDMRADLLDALNEQKAALGEQLKQKHYSRIDAMAARTNEAIENTFIPYEDGGI